MEVLYGEYAGSPLFRVGGGHKILVLLYGCGDTAALATIFPAPEKWYLRLRHLTLQTRGGIMSESFTRYRFIDQNTGRILYHLSINDNQPDHEERLHKKQATLARDKDLEYGEIFFEQLAS